MAFSEELASRIRNGLTTDHSLVEKRMFGGLAFMNRGHMAFGVIRDELMVRVGPDGYDEALGQPHAREMDFTGRALKGFVYVAAPGLENDDDLEAWLQRGLRYTDALPPK